jgi:hypothetical protein
LFWLGLAGGQGASWFLVRRAAARMGRTFREEEAALPPISLSTIPKASEPRNPELVDDEHGPIHWLVSRQRGVRAAVWAAAFLGISSYAGTFTMLRLVGVGGGFLPYYNLPGFVTSMFGGCLLAWAASRFFLDARHRGELELLLTTPVGSKSMVSGQWAAMKGMIAGPLLVMLVPFLVQALVYPARGVENLGLYLFFSVVLGIANTLLSVAALCWVGMWFGLKGRGQAACILRTVALVKVAPYIGAFILQVALVPVLINFGASGVSGSFRSFYLVPQVMTILIYWGLIAYAQRSLARELTGAEPMRFSLRPAAGIG